MTLDQEIEESERILKTAYRQHQTGESCDYCVGCVFISVTKAKL